MSTSRLIQSLSIALLVSSAALTSCADDEPGDVQDPAAAAKRALFVVSNIQMIPAPGGGTRVGRLAYVIG